MTEIERKEIFEIVNTEIAKIEEKIEDLKTFTSPISPDDAIGRISRMDAINNKSIYDASLRNAQNRLTQLQNILTLKDDDSFGICIQCAQSIPLERLKLRPEIRQCANCLKKQNR